MDMICLELATLDEFTTVVLQIVAKRFFHHRVTFCSKIDI